MKKFILSFTFLFLMVCFTMVSCGGGDKKKGEQKANKKQAVALDLTKGKAIYITKCQVCHQANGQGTPKVFPPLANADYLLQDKMRAIKTSLYGTQEPIVVNGIKYNGKMMNVPGGITPEESVEVVNYILNSWGNKGGTVTLEEVKKVIAKHQKKK